MRYLAYTLNSLLLVAATLLGVAGAVADTSPRENAIAAAFGLAVVFIAMLNISMLISLEFLYASWLVVVAYIVNCLLILAGVIGCIGCITGSVPPEFLFLLPIWIVTILAVRWHQKRASGES